MNLRNVITAICVFCIAFLFGMLIRVIAPVGKPGQTVRDTVKVPFSVVIEKPVVSYEYVCDTMLLKSSDFICVTKDSVSYIQIPVTERRYAGTQGDYSYDVTVSGFRPELKSIEISGSRQAVVSEYVLRQKLNTIALGSSMSFQSGGLHGNIYLEYARKISYFELNATLTYSLTGRNTNFFDRVGGEIGFSLPLEF